MGQKFSQLQNDKICLNVKKHNKFLHIQQFQKSVPGGVRMDSNLEPMDFTSNNPNTHWLLLHFLIAEDLVKIIAPTKKISKNVFLHTAPYVSSHFDPRKSHRLKNTRRLMGQFHCLPTWKVRHVDNTKWKVLYYIYCFAMGTN